MTPRYFICAFAFLGLLSLAPPAEAQFVDDEEDQSRRHNNFISNEGFGLRVGILANGMIGAEKPILFRYFDLGFRYKAGEYYIDIRAPVLTLIGDGILVIGSEILFNRYFDPLFEQFNQVNDMTHWELAHARIGYRFRLAPLDTMENWTEPIDMAVGFFGTTDLIFFEFRRDIERTDARELGYDDPLVIGAGGFVALGNTTERFQYDVALGLGGAIRGADVDPDRRVIIAMIDADFQFEIGYGAAAYIRPRVTTYITRLSPATNVGMGLTGGLNIRF